MGGGGGQVCPNPDHKLSPLLLPENENKRHATAAPAPSEALLEAPHLQPSPPPVPRCRCRLGPRPCLVGRREARTGRLLLLLLLLFTAPPARERGPPAATPWEPGRGARPRLSPGTRSPSDGQARAGVAAVTTALPVFQAGPLIEELSREGAGRARSRTALPTSSYPCCCCGSSLRLPARRAQDAAAAVISPGKRLSSCRGAPKNETR